MHVQERVSITSMPRLEKHVKMEQQRMSGVCSGYEHTLHIITVL